MVLNRFYLYHWDVIYFFLKSSVVNARIINNKAWNSRAIDFDIELYHLLVI